MLPSELPLGGRTESVPAGEIGARVFGRTLELSPLVAEWASRHGFVNGGRLLAAFELQPARAAEELGWSRDAVKRAAEQLQDLFSRWH